MASVIMQDLWSELNLILSVFLPFLNVMMNSLFGWEAYEIELFNNIGLFKKKRKHVPSYFYDT